MSFTGLRVILIASLLDGLVGCSIFMRHIDEYGLAVYAGAYFERNRPIEVAVGVPIPIPVIVNSELINYMEGINSTHGVLLLGYSSMFNSVPRQDALIRKHVSFHESRYVFPGNIDSYDIVTEPIGVVFPGNQIFSYYGDSWFEDRGLDEVVANSMSNSNHIVHITDINNITGLIPGCPTELVHLSNNKLVATRRILKGQIIEVVRALLIPASDALATSGPLASMVWYSSEYVATLQTSCDANGDSTNGSCSVSSAKERSDAIENPYYVSPYDPATDYAVMLLGNGALYSGVLTTPDDGDVSAASGQGFNVQYGWWSVDMIDPTAVDLDSAILTDPLPPSYGKEQEHELQCSTKMLMSFSALADIEEGEELRVRIETNVVNGLVYKTMTDEVTSKHCV